ncbi:unnamed protein product [Arctia plantaginis]|uniref:Uncharacterized protein n=1 Tax=Arctia plantaginis TaxID=874455 RepID=A0A8S1B234_ARCPL|nr:unnamed protein product [Arctia plantaginis]
MLAFIQLSVLTPWLSPKFVFVTLQNMQRVLQTQRNVDNTTHSTELGTNEARLNEHNSGSVKCVNKAALYIGSTCAFDGEPRITRKRERREDASLPRPLHAQGTARLTQAESSQPPSHPNPSE